MCLGVCLSAARAQLNISRVTYGGAQCWEIITPWSTLYFEDHNGSSGYKGVVDNEGNDWLQSGFGWGEHQGYRGFPNATGSNFGHASRNSGSTNTITKQDYNHIIINSRTDEMEFNYHIFPSHGAIEVIRAEEEYCFLWEGTTGGSVEEEDYFVTSDGTMYHCRSNERNTMNDFPDEWMYFGDPNLQSVFLHGKRPDDTHGDENWRRLVTFELFSFGRGRDWRRRLTGTDNYYVFTFVDENTSHQDMTQLINELFDEPYVSHGTASDTGVTIRNSTKMLFVNERDTLTAARFPKEGTVSWEVLDAGQITAIDDTSAIVTAPATATTMRVRAEFMGFSDTLAIEISDPADIHLKLNAGGLDVEDWQSAANLITGGERYSFSWDADLSVATDPAPLEVYKTVHHEDHSYNIAVPDGAYTVRIHFVNNADGRKMNYAIEGRSVLSSYGITEDAGALKVAYVKEFEVTVGDGNGLQIEATGAEGSDVFEAGVEIIARGASAHRAAPAVAVRPGASAAVRQTAAAITVSLGGANDLPVRLITPDGRTVARGSMNAGTARLSAPSTGVYLLRIGTRDIRTIHVR
jgi:hypothetical protein